MSTDNKLSVPIDIDELFAEIMEQADKGEAVDQSQLIADNPELADGLRSYFDAADQVEQMAGPQEAHDETREFKEAKESGQNRNSDIAILSSQFSPDQSESPAPAEAIKYFGQFGDYELLDVIARGGMGVVYKARQLSLNRIVAVKMILSGQLASVDEIQRFHTESKAAAALDHPNIVPVYAVGKQGNRHFFTMGYVEGESLAESVRDGPLAPTVAALIMKIVAEAIAYAHKKGVIHRDLKPSNILLAKDGQPRVTDFGLAKQVGGNCDLTATGQVLGTPSYMPPEQAEGAVKRIGPHSDIYSLGAVLYELLTGRPPFQSATSVGVLMQVMNREPVAPRMLNPTIPRDLETICLKCMQKRPFSRFATADLLVAELERFLNNQPIHSEAMLSWSGRTTDYLVVEVPVNGRTYWVTVNQSLIYDVKQVLRPAGKWITSWSLSPPGIKSEYERIKLVECMHAEQAIEAVVHDIEVEFGGGMRFFDWSPKPPKIDNHGEKLAERKSPPVNIATPGWIWGVLGGGVITCFLLIIYIITTR